MAKLIEQSKYILDSADAHDNLVPEGYEAVAAKYDTLCRIQPLVGPIKEVSPEGAPDDILLTMVRIRSGQKWPMTHVAAISHRRDLAGLEEPYLSAVKEALGLD